MDEGFDISIRRATRDDVPEIVRLLADDALGKQRERFEQPLPEAYYQAFREIDADGQQELVQVERLGDASLSLPSITTFEAKVPWGQPSRPASIWPVWSQS